MQVRETATEVMPTQTADVASAAVLPELGPISDRLRAWHVPIVAEVGRAGLLWFALAVVYGSENPLTDAAVVAITLAASIWLVTLKAAASPDILVFGRILSKGCGVGLGLVAVAVLNGSSVGLNLSWPGLAGAALGVMATRRRGTVRCPCPCGEEACPLRWSRRYGRAAAPGRTEMPACWIRDPRRMRPGADERRRLHGRAHRHGRARAACRGSAPRRRRPRGREDVRRSASIGCWTPAPGSVWRVWPASANACSDGFPSSTSVRRGSCAS